MRGKNAPWRDALVVLAVVALFVVGTLVGRQFLGGDDSANGNTSDESQGDFGTRAARFDDLKFTGTYLLTPFDRPTDPVVIPARDRTPGAAITPTPERTPAGPPITVIWYPDGNKHNRFTFHAGSVR